MNSPVKRPVSPFKDSKKVIMEFEKQISPQGVAKANADARKALENKYPGMFIPETRTTPGVKTKKK
jgi:hypothetical protein